ncbi:toprim domain-containing protein [Novosphingobium sp. FKTRR1]|uniref:DUF7146 domain-containing protein n=1 Tax=Novosphingobium sp. FKTRR1 TaxID=2879118 RepID=UPI001CF0C5D6|nr:toprim domain-containing protein [Novosphingobium sp. FKTRR1]
MTVRSVAEIEQELRDNAAAIGRQCLPGAVEEGNYLKAGSILGERGGSLVLNLKGGSTGWWRDYAGTDSGDMLDLIRITQGCATKAQAVAIAKDWLGIRDEWGAGQRAAPDPAELAARAERLRQAQERRQIEATREREAKIRGARALYLHGEARPIAGTPAEAYLAGRGLRPVEVKPGEGPRWPGALRYHPEVYCKDAGVKVPCLLTPLYLADGTHVATHRIWLQPCQRRGWTKLDTEKPKKVLGAMWGAFAPINKGASGKSMRAMREDEPVYVTEGVEDAVVVRMARPEARIVCAISLGNIGAIVLPEAARRLVIVADRDSNPKAVDALEQSIAQQQARGLDVRLVMPPPGIKDVNDWLLGACANGAAA